MQERKSYILWVVLFCFLFTSPIASWAFDKARMRASLNDDQMASEVTGGVKAGINITNVYGDDISGTDSKIGIVGGGFITYNLSDTFAIQSELLFSMKGCKKKSTYEGYVWEETAKLNYLEIPVLAKLLIPIEGNMKPNVYLGPSLGILMSATADDLGIKDYFKSTDFGLVFGGGFDLPIGEGNMTFDARYTMGLSSISKDDYDGTSYDIKNKVISFMVGYKF